MILCSQRSALKNMRIAVHYSKIAQKIVVYWWKNCLSNNGYNGLIIWICQQAFRNYLLAIIFNKYIRRGLLSYLTCVHLILIKHFFCLKNSSNYCYVCCIRWLNIYIETLHFKSSILKYISKEENIIFST